MQFRLPAIAVISAMSLLVGCQNPTSQQMMTDQRVSAEGQPNNMVRTGKKNRQHASFNGGFPTQLFRGTKTVRLTSVGPGTLMVINPKSNKHMLWSPKDVKFDRVEITPQPEKGEPRVVVEGLSAMASSVIEVRVDQFKAAVEAIQNMTKTEAARRIEQMREAGKISRHAATLLKEGVLGVMTGGASEAAKAAGDAAEGNE